MQETSHPAKSRQTVQSRFLWFLAGSGVNYLLISGPFNFLTQHTQLATWEKSACSMAVSTTLFFSWNYFYNFRTDSRKRDALGRYVTAATCMYILQTITLTLLKDYDAHMVFRIFGKKLDLDVVATQFFTAGFKFFLYHKWAFPLPKQPVGEPPSDASKELACSASGTAEGL